MNIRKSQTGFVAESRSGLAPVEMILVLPVLMLMMSIIVVFGYAATWKARSEIVSRDVLWRKRNPRFTNTTTRAIEWPQQVEPEIAEWSWGDVADLETYDGNSVTESPIIRGPIPSVNVNSEILNFGRDVERGVAILEKAPPIMENLGYLDYRVSHVLLEDRFKHWEMGIWNDSRRIPLIYETDLDFVRSSASFRARINAIQQIRNPFLLAIDEDPELIAWLGCPPDFHPRTGSFSSLDRDLVRATVVERLVDRIDDVPPRMIQFTINYYRFLLRGLNPNSAEARRLQGKIDGLEEFLGGLAQDAGG